MPLSGPVFGSLILVEFQNKGFTGAQSPTLALAIGNGAIVTILSSNYYQGQSVGIGTGAGVGTGTINGIVGPIVGGLIFAEMQKVNHTGSQAINLAMAIGAAFADHMKMAIITSTSTPVVSGTGIGYIQGVVGTAMGQSIFAMMGASGLTGSQSLNLANAIGNGLANGLAMGIVNTTIVGAGYPPTPTSGVDIGKMF